MSRVGAIFTRLGRSLRKRTQPALCRGYICGVRGVETFGGPRLLSILLLPVTGADFLRRIPGLFQFGRLRAELPPAFWRHGLVAHNFRMLRAWQESLAAALVYDRLSSPCWVDRLTIHGAFPNPLAEERKRPVILVFLHTGGFALLRYYLRSRGLAAASMVRELPLPLPFAEEIRKLGDERYGLENMPHVFYHHSVRPALRFLRPGRILAMALDGGADSGARIPCEVDGHLLHLKDGAVRLAQLTHSILVPVSVHRRGPLRFEFRFGAAVPDGLSGGGDTRPALEHLAKELWRNLANDPSSLAWSTLEALQGGRPAKRAAWP